MTRSPRESIEHGYGTLRGAFDLPLRAIARRAVRAWFHRESLDRLLADGIGGLDNCELMYAIDANGHQVSSNIHPDSVDPGAYGQDLSRRPYVVSLPVLHNAAFRGAFLCDRYISRVTRRPCITLMHGVTSGSSLLGYIAIDLRLAEGEDGS